MLPDTYEANGNNTIADPPVKTLLLRIPLPSLASGLTAFAAAGCQTTKDLDRAIEHIGAKIQGH